MRLLNNPSLSRKRGLVTDPDRGWKSPKRQDSGLSVELLKLMSEFADSETVTANDAKCIN